MPKSSWLVWQLVDSAFPAGGFAHSYGLEAAWQQGEVDAASLPAFVRDAIAQAGHSGLPFVMAAFDATKTAAHAASAVVTVAPPLALVDERCDAFLRNPVANRASRVQGRAWAGTVARSFPSAEVRAVGFRHFAPVFGASLCALGVQRDEAARMFLFGHARGTLSAAVRLGITGTNDAQRILSERAADLDRTIRRCGDLAIDDAAQTSPLMDLWQASHDRLYSRLFQS
jgi:urease accessory protein